MGIKVNKNTDAMQLDNSEAAESDANRIPYQNVVNSDSPVALPNALEKIMQLPQVSELKRTHTLQREKLGLSKQPIETTRFAVLSLLNQWRLLWIHVLSHHLRFVAAGFISIAIIIALVIVDGPHEYYVRKAIAYARFVVWWIGLGVASSKPCLTTHRSGDFRLPGNTRNAPTWVSLCFPVSQQMGWRFT